MKSFRLIFFLPVFILLHNCGSKSPDLSKGGRIYTIEVDAMDLLYKRSQQMGNTGFEQALQKAGKDHKTHNEKYIRAFARHFAAANPGTSLVAIFSYGDPENFHAKMTDKEVIEKLVEEYSLAVDFTQDILHNRLDHVVGASNINLKQDSEKRIIIEVAGKFDHNRLRKLITTNGGVGFFETYNNFDLYDEIYQIDSLLGHEMNPGSDSIDPNKKLLEGDSKQHPLFKRLLPALREDHGSYGGLQWEKGCRLGMVKPADTAAINEMLKSKTARAILPADIQFVWAYQPEEMEGKRLLSLYTLKAASLLYPAIDGQLVKEAKEDYDPNSGVAIISVSMNEKGTEDLRKFSESNTGKALAIVLEGKVVSAPVVEGPIPNGKVIIQGNFTLVEATEMAMLLKSAGSAVRFYLVTEEVKGPGI